jgi:hypothetical protein
MIIAVVVLGIVVLIMAVALVVSGWVVRDALNTSVESSAALNATDRARAQVERDRDSALADVVLRSAERDQARSYAANLANSLAAAREELSRYVHEKLATGSDSDVALELDRVLGAQLPTMRAIDTAPSVDHSTTGSSAVPST